VRLLLAFVISFAWLSAPADELGRQTLAANDGWAASDGGTTGGSAAGINLYLQSVDNVIIRNLTFEDAFDCFPQWDPTDGASGNCNSQYDKHLTAQRYPRMGRPQLLQ
jgi:pectate lyase